MFITDFLAVNSDCGISHDTFKHQFYFFTIPIGRDEEVMTIFSCLRTWFCRFVKVKTSVGVIPVTLKLPTRRHGDRIPSAGILSGRATKLPFYGIVSIVPRQISYFCGIISPSYHRDKQEDC